MKYRLIALIFIVTCSLLAIYTNPPAYSQPFFCQDVNVIFARGSGQPLKKEESERFFDQIKARLPSSLKFERYELGEAAQNGHQYPAVNVSNALNGNALGAWLSAGTANDYGKSVQEGSAELSNYLVNLRSRCPDSRIVLGGYSQGAQVIGQTVRALPEDAKDHIDFVALLGDPKLNLPEGRGFDPPACHGQQSSPWRRIVENCHTDDGSLGARNPYTSKDMESKTGLWCLDKDFICGSSSFFFINDGHSKYADTDGSIDRAAQEIAEVLKRTLPRPSPTPDNPTPPDIDTRPKVGDAASGPDVMIVLDNSTTASPLHHYPGQIKSTIIAIAEKTIATNGRVGITTYCGCDQTSPRHYSPLTNSSMEVRTILSGLELDSTHYNLSQDLLTTIRSTQTTTQWRPGAKQIIIPITNTPYVQPLALSHPATLASKKIRKISTTTAPTTYIYPVVTPAIASSFSALSVSGLQTQVTMLATIDDMATAITSQFNPQLLAILSSTSYQAKPQDSLTFDATPSQTYNDAIVKYEWDLNGDGEYDQTSTTPTISYAYSSDFNGNMGVRITSNSGFTNNTSALVKIESNPAQELVAKAPTHLQATATSPTTAQLSWQPADTLAASWAISLNGTYIGRIASNQTSVTIGDIAPDQSSELGVRALESDGSLGEASLITINTTTGQQSISEPASNANSPADQTNNLSSTPIDQFNDFLKQTAALLHDPRAQKIIQNTLPWIISIPIGVIVVAGSVILWRRVRRQK